MSSLHDLLPQEINDIIYNRITELRDLVSLSEVNLYYSRRVKNDRRFIEYRKTSKNYRIYGYLCKFNGDIADRGMDICDAIREKYKDFDSMVSKYWELHLIQRGSCGDRGCLKYPPITVDFDVLISKSVPAPNMHQKVATYIQFGM